jgi:hypothetical protein
MDTIVTGRGRVKWSWTRTPERSTNGLRAGPLGAISPRPAYGAPSAGTLVARYGALFGLRVGRAGQCGIERFPYDG